MNGKIKPNSLVESENGIIYLILEAKKFSYKAVRLFIPENAEFVYESDLGECFIHNLDRHYRRFKPHKITRFYR